MEFSKYNITFLSNILNLVNEQSFNILIKDLLVDNNHKWNNKQEFMVFIMRELDIKDIKYFLNSLDNKNYIILPLLYNNYQDNMDPLLFLSPYFIINKNSNPIVIHNFIFQQLNKAMNNLNMELSFNDEHSIVIRYKNIILP